MSIVLLSFHVLFLPSPIADLSSYGSNMAVNLSLPCPSSVLLFTTLSLKICFHFFLSPNFLSLIYFSLLFQPAPSIY
ncbi:hypothetical protein AMTRI_Chr03g44280 [Amborella trichopoda]